MKPTPTNMAVNSALGIVVPAAIITWIGMDWRDALLIAFLAYYVVNHGLDRSLSLETLKTVERLSAAMSRGLTDIINLVGAGDEPAEKEKS